MFYIFAAAGIGCNSGGSASSGAGGVVTTGGNGASGGATETSNSGGTSGQSGKGGASGTGGRDGGAVAAGGTNGSGGETAAGGSAASGGAIQTGGNAGGSVVTGGAATGGAAASGGAPSSGGALRTGGAPSSGGVAAGGSTGAGGATPAAGGASGTCAESTCGSHKWACWKMPNPASSPATVPNHQSYTDLGNGAVRDNVTCLVWEKANPATPGTWQANVDRCTALGTSNYAGFSDWRLPTRVEMASITDVTLGAKGFPTIFSLTSGYYQTSSWWYETITGQNTSNFGFAYGANGFTSNAVSMDATTNVARCVRGNGTGEAANAFAVEPPNHYTIIGAPPTGEVTDNYTGLTWQQGFSPATMNWADGPAYCAALSLNGHAGFRMPTLNELASTVNEALVGGAINRTAFPGNPNGCKAPEYWFWAAEASEVGGTAWGLSYCDGFTGWNVGATSGIWNYFPTANVRCVR